MLTAKRFLHTKNLLSWVRPFRWNKLNVFSTQKRIFHTSCNFATLLRTFYELKLFSEVERQRVDSLLHNYFIVKSSSGLVWNYKLTYPAHGNLVKKTRKTSDVYFSKPSLFFLLTNSVVHSIIQILILRINTLFFILIFYLCISLFWLIILQLFIYYQISACDTAKISQDNDLFSSCWKATRLSYFIHKIYKVYFLVCCKVI